MNQKNTVLLFVTFAIAFEAFAQNPTNDSYLPLHKGNTWVYHLAGCPPNFTIKTKVTEANVAIATHEYFHMASYYGKTTLDKYLRAEEKAVYSINKRTHAESVEFPKQIAIGQSWETPDRNWHYEIIHLSDTLTTPHATYQDLLHIRADLFEEIEKYKPGIYDFYYKKGIGCVACKRNGTLREYLIESKLK